MKDGWVKSREVSQRRIVIVDGWEKYYTTRSRRWWLESQPRHKVVELCEPSIEGILERVNPGIIEVPVTLVANKLSLPDDRAPLESFLSRLKELKSSVYINLDGTRELTSTIQVSLRKFRSKDFGYLVLEKTRWYDRRKKTWTSEILRHFDLFLDDRARDYVLDWCRWDMDEVEAQCIRLSLLLETGKVVAISTIQEYLPPGDEVKDLAQLARVKNSGYFTTLEAGLQSLDREARRRLINKHLSLLDKIKILLLVKRDEELDPQYEKLKKASPYPLTRGQFNAILKAPQASKADLLDFLSRSSEFLSGCYRGDR